MRILKLLSLIVLLSAANAVSGQTVNDMPIEEIDTPYLEIKGISKAFSTKLIVTVNFGQHVKAFRAGEMVIKDANGQNVEFNSMVDAMNFFDDLGYEFLQAYVVTIANQNVYHYLMKKSR